MPLRRPFFAVPPVRRPAGLAASTAAALLAAAALPAAAGPVTLTFDQTATGGGPAASAASWYEGSYALTFDGVYSKVSRAATCRAGCAANGGDYLLSRGATLSITPTLSRTFALTSFDAAGGSAGVDGGWAQYIDVTGFKWDGSTVSQRFAIDPIEDGAAGFWSYALGPDFLELRSVSLRNGGSGSVYALDNIRLGDASAAAVPEPGTIALVAVALLAAAGSRRRQAPHGACA